MHNWLFREQLDRDTFSRVHQQLLADISPMLSAM